MKRFIESTFSGSNKQSTSKNHKIEKRRKKKQGGQT